MSRKKPFTFWTGQIKIHRYDVDAPPRKESARVMLQTIAPCSRDNKANRKTEPLNWENQLLNEPWAALLDGIYAHPFSEGVPTIEYSQVSCQVGFFKSCFDWFKTKRPLLSAKPLWVCQKWPQSSSLLWLRVAQWPEVSKIKLLLKPSGAAGILSEIMGFFRACLRGPHFRAWSSVGRGGSWGTQAWHP